MDCDFASFAWIETDSSQPHLFFPFFVPVSLRAFQVYPRKRAMRFIQYTRHGRAGIAQSVKRLATGWMVQGSNPGVGKIFRTRSDRPWGPPSLLYNRYRVYPEDESAGTWRWQPTPSSAEVKERVELYLHSPSGPSWPVLGWPLPLHLHYTYVSNYKTDRAHICSRQVKALLFQSSQALRHLPSHKHITHSGAKRTHFFK